MKNRKLHIIIVGAGASGLMAAISAAQAGAHVTLLEQKEKTGKKILATGNGHCNFTNDRMYVSCYHGNEFGFQYTAERIPQFFIKLFHKSAADLHDFGIFMCFSL